MLFSFDQINPFVRYAHHSTIMRDTTLINVVAYDHRMIYIIGGKGRMEIDGKFYPAYKGCLFIWKPGIKYSFLPDEDTPYTMYGISFDFTMNHYSLTAPLIPDDYRAFDPSRMVDHIEFSDFPAFGKTIYLKHMLDSEDKFRQIIYEFMTRKNYYSIKIRTCLLSLFYDIANMVNKTYATQNENSSEHIDRVIAYIQSNYYLPLTNKNISQHFNFHPVYISRLMVKHTGLPLHRYMIHYRIYVSLDLLQTTNMRISDIAETVGFSDVNYFSRSFKQYIGTSPSKYRANNV